MNKELAHKLNTLIKALYEANTLEHIAKIDEMIFTIIEKEVDKALK